ncbi:hypothetical protein JNK13_02410, partial [bacterium]|nr:hypothetical protein [bacterium]
IGLGLFNIIAVHGGRILRIKQGWQYSSALVFGLIAMLVVEASDVVKAEKALKQWQQVAILSDFVDHIYAQQTKLQVTNRLAALERELVQLDQHQAALSEFQALRQAYQANNDSEIQAKSSALKSALGVLTTNAKAKADQDYEASTPRKISHFIQTGFFAPLGSAMFALLAFYIANAAYRSFRIRSREAFLMMVAALIVMLGQIPFGPMYISSDLPQLRLWLLKNISTPAFRAISFGASIAGLALAVRMWLSLERAPFQDGK